MSDRPEQVATGRGSISTPVIQGRFTLHTDDGAVIAQGDNVVMPMNKAFEIQKKLGRLNVTPGIIAATNAVFRMGEAARDTARAFAILCSLLPHGPKHRGHRVARAKHRDRVARDRHAKTN